VDLSGFKLYIIYYLVSEAFVRFYCEFGNYLQKRMNIWLFVRGKGGGTDGDSSP
jgi:hypothetical protein